MCLQVYPNGYGDGTSTHVSIFNYIMRGPFDAQLKWPFRGDITFQILNQMEECNHIKYTVKYTDVTDDKYAGRVTDAERSEGWGCPNFLSHSLLGLDLARNTKYVQCDTLRLGIIKVRCKS